MTAIGIEALHAMEPVQDQSSTQTNHTPLYLSIVAVVLSAIALIIGLVGGRKKSSLSKHM